MTTPIVPSITDEQIAEIEIEFGADSSRSEKMEAGGYWADHIILLIARLRCAEKDAARYRWLRDSGYLYSWTDLHVCDEHRSAEITDQAIDAAMEQSK